MKSLKFILVLLFITSFSSCSDEDTTPLYVLSNANLAGTYNINNLNVSAKAIAVTSGIPVTISNASSVGSTFQINFTINANGTYTVSGEYVMVSTVTPIGGSAIQDTSIIVINDSGSYQINTSNSTITFTSAADDFLSGEFKVITFNETTVSLNQESEEVDGPITTEIDANISFTRI